MGEPSALSRLTRSSKIARYQTSSETVNPRSFCLCEAAGVSTGSGFLSTSGRYMCRPSESRERRLSPPPQPGSCFGPLGRRRSKRPQLQIRSRQVHSLPSLRTRLRCQPSSGFRMAGCPAVDCDLCCCVRAGPAKEDALLTLSVATPEPSLPLADCPRQ